MNSPNDPKIIKVKIWANGKLVVSWVEKDE